MAVIQHLSSVRCLTVINSVTDDQKGCDLIMTGIFCIISNKEQCKGITLSSVAPFEFYEQVPQPTNTVLQLLYIS